MPEFSAAGDENIFWFSVLLLQTSGIWETPNSFQFKWLCLFGLKDIPIRFWWSKVKINMSFCSPHSCQHYILGTFWFILSNLAQKPSLIQDELSTVWSSKVEFAHTYNHNVVILFWDLNKYFHKYSAGTDGKSNKIYIWTSNQPEMYEKNLGKVEYDQWKQKWIIDLLPVHILIPTNNDVIHSAIPQEGSIVVWIVQSNKTSWHRNPNLQPRADGFHIWVCVCREHFLLKIEE